jgi:hypothetical protein
MLNLSCSCKLCRFYFCSQPDDGNKLAETCCSFWLRTKGCVRTVSISGYVVMAMGINYLRVVSLVNHLGNIRLPLLGSSVTVKIIHKSINQSSVVMSAGVVCIAAKERNVGFSDLCI